MEYDDRLVKAEERVEKNNVVFPSTRTGEKQETKYFIHGRCSVDNLYVDLLNI